MPEISNSVRQRLGARPALPTHPDADLLTAYVEQVLPAGERLQIVEHLAACPFCRDIVALSLPELPEKTMVQSLPAPSGFWTFGLRWAGALAVIALAVTLVIQKPWQKNRIVAVVPAPTVAKAPRTDSANTSKVAESAQSANPAPDRVNSDSSSGTNLHSLAATRSPAVAESQSGRIVPAVPPVPPRVDIAQNAVMVEDGKDAPAAVIGKIEAASNEPKESFRNTNIFFSDEPAGGPSNRSYVANNRYAGNELARAEAAVRAKEGPASSLTAAKKSSDLDTDSPKSFLRTAIPKLNPTRLGPLATNALTAVKSVATGSGSDASAGERAGVVSAFAGPPARPPITQRSATGTAALIPHESLEARRAKAASPGQLHWRVQDGKLVNSPDLNQWHEAYPPQSDDIQFKVVEAQGHDVWAGGTNGTLVHSWNGGVDWQKLNLGDAASGDIDKISFPSGGVQVKTSNGQTVISRDGGKTWAPLNPQSNPAQPNQPK